MPLYEYQCTACGHRFEIIRKWSDPPQETCPKCGGPVHKLQSAPAFQFKGTGWYVTDYAKKDQGGSAKSAESDKKSAEDAAEKTEKAEKAEKTDKPEKTDSSKGSSSGEPSSSSSPSKSS
jgi:putative FmdB family regulatory protein